MSTSKIYLLAALIVVATSITLAFKSIGKQSNAAGNGFAVVELFTSEGCSSCPPADAVVARLLKASEGKPVYVLGFHVDYWNHLGWRDEFSKPEYSARQRKYAQWLNLQSVYTPQIVVNGKTEFVGSEEGTLKNAVTTNLNKHTAEALMVNSVHINTSTLAFTYQAQGNGVNNKVLLIAFVQKTAQSKVKSGENSGNVLNHVNIVRQLDSVDLKAQTGNVIFKLPQHYNQQTWDVIGFIQNTSTGEILSAQKVLISGV